MGRSDMHDIERMMRAVWGGEDTNLRSLTPSSDRVWQCLEPPPGPAAFVTRLTSHDDDTRVAPIGCTQATLRGQPVSAYRVLCAWVIYQMDVFALVVAMRAGIRTSARSLYIYSRYNTTYSST